MNYGADISRHWEYYPPEKGNRDYSLDPIRIILRHNPITQTAQVTAGNKEFEPGMLQFKLGKNTLGRVIIEPLINKSLNFGVLQRFSKYSYKCFVEDDNGESELVENLDKTKDMTCGVKDVQVRIPEMVIDGTKTVWYKIQVSMVQFNKDSERLAKFEVHRRFRDFRFTYKQIVSAFKGSHLASSLPKHPQREFSFVQDHTEEAFLRGRQSKLENWLRNTLQFPRAASNADVLSFLGMGDPNFRETSVVQDINQLLGLKMKKRLGVKISGSENEYENIFPQAVVQEIVPGNNGQPGVALGKIFPGDAVTRLAGESVVHTSYEAIISRLQMLPKPLIIHFLARVDRNSNLNNDKDYDLPSFSGDSINSNSMSELGEEHNTKQEKQEGYYEEEERSSSNIFMKEELEDNEQFIGYSNNYKNDSKNTNDVAVHDTLTSINEETQQPVTNINASKPKGKKNSLFARSKPKDINQFLAQKKNGSEDPIPSPKPAPIPSNNNDKNSVKNSNGDKNHRKSNSSISKSKSNGNNNKKINNADDDTIDNILGNNTLVEEDSIMNINESMTNVIQKEDQEHVEEENEVLSSSPMEDLLSDTNEPPPARPPRRTSASSTIKSTKEVFENPILNSSDISSKNEDDLFDFNTLNVNETITKTSSTDINKNKKDLNQANSTSQDKISDHNDMEYNDDDLEDVSF